ncbi:hypothetical protein ABHC39_05330 [Pediococcus acidilactici]|uniref:hypothetical protein n=1 Tax=Pediococcus acidilactici TaxID=1254 RepID=UPI00232F8294|nr:hypothetical protein [Pediococcus acidilactici]MDB8867645.1 hypothetical protein [Pediococcus acidilactici]
MKKITSINGNTFISDNNNDSSEVWKGNFVWLFCNKNITEKSVSFEYPSVLFKELNMIKSSDILSIENATVEEEKIFNKINNAVELSKEDKKYLKANFLSENKK